MPSSEKKTPEELEQEFLAEMGMGDFVSRFLVWFYSLFDGGKTKICLAALYGRTEEVERTLFFEPKLIEATWDWAMRSKMTLLHCAVLATRNREMTLELLLKKGLSVKLTDAEGLTPMEYVLQRPRDHQTRRLISILRKHGAF